MFDFDSLSHAMIRQTVLCVGDLMLDEFVYGELSRISPEAPAPVNIGHEIVEADGGEVLLVEVLPGFSTTSLVNRAREGTA